MRIRTLKPSIWRDEKVRRLSRDARLLFVGLITLADDEGRFDALPSVLEGHIYPFDKDARKRVTGWLRELVDVELVRLYGPEGEYGLIPNWKRHQRISHASPSVIPSPDSRGVPERLRNDSRELPEAI